MPPTPQQPWTWRMRIYACALLAGLVAALYYSVAFRFILTLIVLISIIMNWIESRLLARLAASRPRESIGSFAFALDFRNIDTWVIRAVYEELQEWVSTRKLVVPVRPSDRLEDFGIDSEALNLDLGPEIAQRCGRTFDGCERNPYFGKVITVADLVQFFAHQPKAVLTQLHIPQYPL
jgi:hypothetical protein